jgi:hypothetical protein
MLRIGFGCLVLTAAILITPAVARASACFSSTILTPTPFMGNNDEIFRLADGSIWKVFGSYEYMYEYYPNVTVCPSVGKMMIKNKTIGIVSVSDHLDQKTDKSEQIIVVFNRTGCHDYFVAHGPTGYYLLEWYGGHDPSEGDTIAGEISSYGFRDVIYSNSGQTGRVWVDDYMLSKSTVTEKINEKCR